MLADAPAINSDGFGRAASYLRAWREDPVRFVVNELRATPDPWQLGPLRAFPHHQRISLKACKGPGKTAILSWLILNFLVTRPAPKIVVTSITGENLRDNLWAELSKWGRRSMLIKSSFEFQVKRIYARHNPEEWFVAARTWAREADPDRQEKTLAGYHAEFMLFVLDEAGGIPRPVAAAAKGALSTGTEVKLIVAGNPTHLEGPLYDSWHSEADKWDKYHVHALPDRPDRSDRVDEDWARDMRDEYGERSAWYQVNVGGDFPSGATDALIPLGDIVNAYGREVLPDGSPLAREPRVLGLDVARQGSDWNRCCHRHGDWIEGFTSWQGLDTMETAKKARAIRREGHYELIRCDSIGVGAGVYDKLMELKEPVEGIQASETADQDEEYFNIRSEMAGELRRRFMHGQVGLNPAIEKETTFAQEASTIEVGFDEKGRHKLQRKDIFKRRHRYSPNFLDAAMMAFADEVVVGIADAGEEQEGYKAERRGSRDDAGPWSSRAGRFGTGRRRSEWT